MSPLLHLAMAAHVARLAADHFGKREIVSTTHIHDDLRGNEFNLAEFGMLLEAEFDVDLPEDWSLGLATIGDVVDLIDRLTNTRAGDGGLIADAVSPAQLLGTGR